MDRIQKLQELLQSSPQDAFLLHALALEHIKIGDDTKARELFENLLSLQPNYTGSYYHLAKLLERIGEQEEAIKVYEKGMLETKKLGDNHAYSELRAALEELTFE